MKIYAYLSLVSSTLLIPEKRTAAKQISIVTSSIFKRIRLNIVFLNTSEHWKLNRQLSGVSQDELQLKAFCNELVSNFDNFLAELKSSSNVSNIEDDVRKRVASERLFSEWAFKVAYDKCL